MSGVISASSTLISTLPTPKFAHGSRSPSPTNAKKQWRKISTAVIATHFFKTPDVSVMQDVNELLADVENSPFTRLKADPTELYSAVEAHRTLERLFELVARGSFEDIAEIDTILKTDPKRYLRESTDPQSLVNKKSKQGQTLVYQAALHGHLQVVDLLISSGANVHEPSVVGDDATETPLDAACRWSYPAVVDILLRDAKWTKREIRAAMKLVKSEEIRLRLVAAEKKHRSKKKCHFCF